jgi:hypothetical protein
MSRIEAIRNTDCNDPVGLRGEVGASPGGHEGGGE